MTTDLAILDNLRIPAPCSADWAQMTGDERARLCGQCQKHVYNISGMSAEDAVALIREKEGHLCAQLFRRADGTVMTSDCPIGLRAIARRTRRVVAACLAAVVVGLVFLVLPREANRPQSAVLREVSRWVDDVLVWIGVRTPPVPVVGRIAPSAVTPTVAPEAEGIDSDSL